jgi:hypothetical protein
MFFRLLCGVCGWTWAPTSEWFSLTVSGLFGRNDSINRAAENVELLGKVLLKAWATPRALQVHGLPADFNFPEERADY